MYRVSHNATSKQKRARRVRLKIRGTAERPRLTVFCSNRFTYVQVVDDQQGKTLASANELQLAKAKKAVKGTKTERAAGIAEALITQLKKQKVTKLAFDRGSRRYHGRVKTIAEAMRAAGIDV